MIQMILVALIVILFSGCANAEDQEPVIETENISVYDKVTYNSETLSIATIDDLSEFTSDAVLSTLMLDTNDIVYSIRLNYSDMRLTYIEFELVYESISGKVLSSVEKKAYSDLLSVLSQLNKKAGTPYPAILNYTSSELKDECEKEQILITATNIIVFNQFKELLDEMIETNGSSYESIEKVDYLNSLLDRMLTVIEVDALEHLQIIYYDLNVTYNQDIDLSSISFEDLMEEIDSFEVYTEPPDPSKIRVAYDILQEIK